jgi:hypothetical protein
MSIRKQKIGEPDIFADQMDVCGMDDNFNKLKTHKIIECCIFTWHQVYVIGNLSLFGLQFHFFTHCSKQK